jgi:hypothetical protein
MHQRPYLFEYDFDKLIFVFESISDRKTITKVISYTVFPDQPELYNLFLGDVLPDGSLCDTQISNNDDLEKILATVIQTMLLFF